MKGRGEELSIVTDSRGAFGEKTANMWLYFYLCERFLNFNPHLTLLMTGGYSLVCLGFNGVSIGTHSFHGPSDLGSTRK